MSVPTFGVFTFSVDGLAAPGVLARAAEDRGLDMILFCEHTHFPLDTAGARDIDPVFLHANAAMRDPLVAAAFAAAVTSRITVGTSVTLLPLRDILLTAKEVATIATLAGNNRFLFGIGAGWNHEELRNHGVNPSTRWARLEEQIQALRDIWGNEESEFHGNHVDYGPLLSWPKAPETPIYLGGAGRLTLSLVTQYANGWLPLGRAVTAAQLREARRHFADQGREDLHILLLEGQVKNVGEDPETIALTEERAAEYLDSGADGLIFFVPPGSDSASLARIDEIATIVAKLR